MLYAILIYGDSETFGRLSKAEQDAVVEKHDKLQASLIEAKMMGPVAKLFGPSTAVTVSARNQKPVVTDGPFAETKEQLLGFYTVECATIEEAIEAAKQLPLDVASMEVRPVDWFHLGVVGPTREDG